MRPFWTLFALVALLACASAFSSYGFATPAKKQSTALHMTKLTYGGKAKDFKPGSKLSAACSALGVKPRYSCKK